MRACNPVGARFDERFFVPPQVFWNETGVALAAALAKVLPGLPGGPLLLPNCESGSACQKSDNSGSAIAGYNGVFEEFFGTGAGNETTRGDQEVTTNPFLMGFRG